MKPRGRGRRAAASPQGLSGSSSRTGSLVARDVAIPRRTPSQSSPRGFRQRSGATARRPAPVRAQSATRPKDRRGQRGRNAARQADRKSGLAHVPAAEQPAAPWPEMPRPNQDEGSPADAGKPLGKKPPPAGWGTDLSWFGDGGQQRIQDQPGSFAPEVRAGPGRVIGQTLAEEIDRKTDEPERGDEPKRHPRTSGRLLMGGRAHGTPMPSNSSSSLRCSVASRSFF